MTITPLEGVVPAVVATGLVLAVTITPSEITATIVAIAALVTALGTAVVNILVARAQTREIKAAAVKVEEVNRKADEIAVIGGHVNSAASKAAAQIDALQAELKNIREQMADKDIIAKLLAQAAAMAASPGPIVAPVVTATDPQPLSSGGTTGEKLANIEKHTSDTAKNTASTEATVQDLKDAQ